MLRAPGAPERARLSRAVDVLEGSWIDDDITGYVKELAGWFAESGAPFAIEAVRRTPSDRKGGHFARRKSDGRIVLRETAQTPDADKADLALELVGKDSKGNPLPPTLYASLSMSRLADLRLLLLPLRGE